MLNKVSATITAITDTSGHFLLSLFPLSHLLLQHVCMWAVMEARATELIIIEEFKILYGTDTSEQLNAITRQPQ